jgi:starch phosphorylase
VGTLDGANVEIREAVGAENFFLFGLDVDGVAALKKEGYSPAQAIESSDRLRGALDLIASGFFSPDDEQRFEPVVRDMWTRDHYMVCADFDAYADCHAKVAAAYRDPDRWARMVVNNLAHVGRFSSDRTIREYAREIWGAEPVHVIVDDRSYPGTRPT